MKKFLVALVMAFGLLAGTAEAAPYLHLQESKDALGGFNYASIGYNNDNDLYPFFGDNNYSFYGYTRYSSTYLCLTFYDHGRLAAFRSYRTGDGYKINDAYGC